MMNETTTASPSFLGGLLDTLSTPVGQGILSAAFGGMAAARRGQPWNSLGRAGQAGLLGYANAQERHDQAAQADQAKKLRDLQIQQTTQTVQDAAELRTLAGQYYKPATPVDAQQALAAPGQLGPTQARASMIGAPGRAEFDSNGFLQAYMAKNPIGALELQSKLAKETPFNKIDPKDFTPESIAKFAQTRNYGDLTPVRKKDFAPDGRVVDLYTAEPGSAYSDPNKPFMRDGNGKVVANAPYQRFELGKARAGAPSVNVRNDIKTGESLAGQIGPMVKESWTAAQGAVQTADAADRVIRAVDSGKIIAGPFANGRLTAAQLGDALGVGGKDSIEKITNTRQAIRGLAEMTLQGRKQMSGQGAITESESKLAERAMSGEITMTPSEIKQLANASRRAAKWTYDQHQAQIRNMRQDQNLSGMSRFYDVAPFPTTESNTGNAEVDYGSLK